ncbi:C2H2 transcription factor [Apiospora aurea]|uniref:C2H2 transcription factor n=1 Tax=Apiospora aurea TaxID=335848 RepID=A0ABR1QEY7_9PEZI
MAVALTLGHLRDPGPQDQPQDPNLVQFGCPIFGQSGSLEKLCGVTQPIPSIPEPPPLCPDTADDSPGTLTDSSPKSGKQCPTDNRCRWKMGGGSIKCDRIFNTSDELNSHVCDDHVNHRTAKDGYMCRWHGCPRDPDKPFGSKNKLRRHVTTHTHYKPFECHDCGEGFSARQALEQHERCHSGAKPYMCDTPGCGKAFKQKSALTMHKRTHTGEKPLICAVCGKRFGESSNLSKHRKIHNTDGKLTCDEPNCGKQFIRADQLRRHQETHQRRRDARQKKYKARNKSAIDQENAVRAATMVSEQYQFPLPSCGVPPNT